MKRHKWLWIVACALCALAVALGFLERPEDDLAGIMRFHSRPTVAYVPGTPGPKGSSVEELQFTAPAFQVLASLPGTKRRFFQPVRFLADVDVPRTHYDVDLPGGRRAMVFDDYDALIAEPGCLVYVSGENRPWYLREWATIRSRLGFLNLLVRQVHKVPSEAGLQW